MTQRFVAMKRDSVTVARQLLGQQLVRVIRGKRLAGIIVETEAYMGAIDRAAHTWGGRRTPRNESMYLPGGHAYVYFTYGMHHCLNVVCGKKDEGVAVLIRALEPTEGLEVMKSNRRHAKSDRDLCSGPGKLTQALAIDLKLDGENLLKSTRLFIERIRDRTLSRQAIKSTPRIGLDSLRGKADDWVNKPLRFLVSGSPYVSR